MQLRTPLLKCTARFSSSLPDAYAFDEHIADVFEVGQLLFNLDQVVSETLLHHEAFQPFSQQRNLKPINDGVILPDNFGQPDVFKITYLTAQ